MHATILVQGMEQYERLAFWWSSRLNSPEAITPLAYLNRLASEVVSIFDQPKSALRDVLTAHLRTEKVEGQEPTQFSSWSASITVPFFF